MLLASYLNGACLLGFVVIWCGFGHAADKSFARRYESQNYD